MFPEFEDFKLYLLQKNASAHTINGYEHDLKQFYEFIKLPVQQITKQHLTKYILYLKEEKKLAPASINRKINSLKSFFRFLTNEGIIKSNPAKTIPLAKQERKLPKTLEVKDILKVITFAESLRDRLIFEILFATGIRRKGKKERYVPVAPATLERIKEYVEETKSEWLFPGRNDTHLTPTRVNEIFMYYRDKLNIPNLTPHKLRHTFATVMFENGADIKVIQDLMGHASINTTNIYAKTSNKRNIEEYMKFHPLANL
ncbi:MAG: tyrosine-type recombinase/integrase [Sulfolobaceae archaeon]